MMNVSKKNFYCQKVHDDGPDTSYLTQTMEKDGVDFSERYEEYKRGDFYFVGIQASVELEIPHGDNECITQTITTPGCWGIESDNDKKYFDEIYTEQCDVLTDMLTTMGITVID